jgi:hypothetical protein
MIIPLSNDKIGYHFVVHPISITQHIIECPKQ